MSSLRSNRHRRRWFPWLTAAALAVVGLTAARPASAFSKVGRADGVQLSSPEIVPLFWGNWPTTGTNNQSAMRDYLRQFSWYLSGLMNPLGLEPTPKQYGVWGAQVLASNVIGLGSDTKIHDSTVYQRIHSLQASNKLPANSPNRVFIVFLKGFSYDFSDNSKIDGNLCGYHYYNGGTYYAVVPWELAAGRCDLQNIVSHELLEAMTNPEPEGFSAGTFPGPRSAWTAATGTLGTTAEEIADTCAPQNQLVTATMDTPSIARGQTFNVTKVADDSAQSCAGWSRATSPTLTAIDSPPGTMNVFWTVPPRVVSGGGALGHAWSVNGLPFQTEIIRTGSNLGFAGAPTAVTPTLGRLDVYVYSTLGTIHKFSQSDRSSSWTFGVAFQNATTPASAVSPAELRTDVVFRNNAGTIDHYWSNDSTNFAMDTLGVISSIGPPIIRALGSGYYNVFTYGWNANVAVHSFVPGVGWTSGGPTGTGWLNGAQPKHPVVPVPFAATYVGTMAQPPPFNQAVIVSMGNGMSNGNGDGTSTQLYTPYIKAASASYSFNNGYWDGAEYHDMMPNGFPVAFTPFGAVAAGAHVERGDPQGLDIAWWDYYTQGYVYQNFQARSGWGNISSQSAWSAPIRLGGVFTSPPVLGEQGEYTYVFGVGQDRCLYTTSFRRVDGPPGAPTFAGACNVL
ncbi:MAG TPA: hypothetical protein VHM31_20555 [Polyangia bacterium]|nr:hypothetical protein [Polyangia bacterium]